LIRGGRVVYLHSFGARNVTAATSLDPDTVMYGASLTKAVFATMVMQLVDEKRLDLDRSIGDYLPKPLPAYPRYADLAGDPRWWRLTFRMLLSHTTGFANFRWLEPDKRLRFHRDPGARYGYSGEGMQLAQFVLEQGLGLDVGAEIQRRIFDRFGMGRSSMAWREASADNAADFHLRDGTIVPHRHRGKADVAGSLDTSLRDWSGFLAGVSRGEGLSRAGFAEMTRASIAIDSPTQFPTLSDQRTDANRAIKLGYGIGWGVFETPYGPAFFKEGHDDGTGHYALCIEPKRDCILLLSNSDRGEGIFKPLVEALIGDVGLPWRWEGYAPFDAAAP
jgi:CubicO group peptidase (beta-lactamase class C family)